MIIVLIIITIQDIAYRRIHVLSIIALLGLSIWKAIYLGDLRSVVFESGLIICFLVIQVLLVQLYFKIRQGNWVEIDKQIGWGDILLLLSIIPLFSLKSYTLFYCFSILFSLLLHITIKLSKLTKDNRIPLAAYLSIFLIGLLSINFIYSIPFRL